LAGEIARRAARIFSRSSAMTCMRCSAVAESTGISTVSVVAKPRSPQQRHDDRRMISDTNWSIIALASLEAWSAMLRATRAGSAATSLNTEVDHLLMTKMRLNIQTPAHASRTARARGP